MCINKPAGFKGKGCGIDVSGDKYPCGTMENNECGSTGWSTESSLGLEESNGLSEDLASCWEVLRTRRPTNYRCSGTFMGQLGVLGKVLEAPCQ